MNKCFLNEWMNEWQAKETGLYCCLSTYKNVDKRENSGNRARGLGLALTFLSGKPRDGIAATAIHGPWINPSPSRPESQFGGTSNGGAKTIMAPVSFHTGLLSRPCRIRRPSAREDGGVSGVSSSCGARGGFLPRHDEDLRDARVCEN